MVGVALADVFEFHESDWVIILGLIGVACIANALLYKKRLFLIGVFLVSIGILGVIRVAAITPFKVLPEGEQIFVGTIVDEPDVREKNTQYVLSLENQKGYANVLVILARYPEYHYGDVLEVKGKVVTPKDFLTDSGRMFDYTGYLLATKHVMMVSPYPSVTLLDQGKGNFLVRALFAAKAAMLSRAQQEFSEPAQSLLAGMLFGGKQSLGNQWITYFRNAGLVHIVVLSGYNMSVVAEWFAKLSRPLGMYGSSLVGVLGIIMFSIMSGGGATVLRAVVMSVLVVLARVSGRTYVASRALFIAAFFMVLIEPRILLHDPSFQLSFLATLGLIHLSPLVERWMRKYFSSPLVLEIITSTISTQIAVLPLLLYSTGILSLVSLPANLLVLPVVPIAMVFGVVAVCLGMIVPPLGFIVSLPASLAISWMLIITRFFGSLPFATIEIPPFGGWILFVAYLGIILWVRRAQSLARSHP